MPKKLLDTISKNKNYVKKTVIETPLDTFDAGKKKSVKKRSSKSTFKLSLNRIKRRRLKIWSIVILILIFFTILLYGPVKSIASITSLFQDGKYLILFQNNAELRGGGGFIGSFAVIDIKDHRLKSYYFEANIYKADKEFVKTNSVEPPTFIRNAFGPGNYFALRDSNYSADFSLAAANVARFYNLEYGGEKVNGVVAINASLVKDLLKLTGPITTKDGTRVTSNNFFSQVQEKVENGYFIHQANIETNEPKSILKDMVPIILGKIKSHNPIQTYHFIVDQLRYKNILFWFNDEREANVTNKGWSGTIPQNNNELIYVSNNNLDGMKTSLSVDESIKLTGSSSSYTRQMDITRSYNKKVEDQRSVGHINYDYAHIILPAGSSLLSVSQDGKELLKSEFEITNIKNKMAVGLWMSTNPEQTKVTSIKYILPSDINLNTINYVKQPGVESEYININFDGKNYFQGILNQDKLFKIKS